MIYECVHCSYKTIIKSHFNRHLNTKKHTKNTKELCSLNLTEKNISYKFIKNDQKVTINDDAYL